jgi:adenylate cyclase
VVEQLSLLTRPETEAVAPQIMPATVVFADLSGISRLTERWRSRPQALVNLLDIWFEFASRSVFSHGGTLDKFIGDGIMAVFGAPFPLDGASARALRAVLEMRESVARLARDTGENLGLTAALAAGPVFSCMTGSKRRHEYTALGETVGRAAKLRERAATADLLCDETAAAEVGPLAHFEPITLPELGQAWRYAGPRT